MARAFNATPGDVSGAVEEEGIIPVLDTAEKSREKTSAALRPHSPVLWPSRWGTLRHWQKQASAESEIRLS